MKKILLYAKSKGEKMKKILYISLVMLLLTGCGNNKTYKTISATEAKYMMNEKAIILDVRTKEEYEISYIKNAINIPLDEIDKSIEETLKDKNQTILVYCQSGNRSKQASQKLVDLGYTSVYNFGGLNDWRYETASLKRDNTELLLTQIISSIKLTYLNEVIDNNVTLPFEVKCDGKTCTYGEDKVLSLAGSLIPEGTFILGSESEIEATAGILFNGYSCSIGENEKVTCN